MRVTETDSIIAEHHTDTEPDPELGRGANDPEAQAIQTPISTVEEAEAEVRLSLLEGLIAEPAGAIYRPRPGRPVSGPVETGAPGRAVTS